MLNKKSKSEPLLPRLDNQMFDLFQPKAPTTIIAYYTRDCLFVFSMQWLFEKEKAKVSATIRKGTIRFVNSE